MLKPSQTWLTLNFESRSQIQNTMTFNIHTVYQVGGEVSGDIPLRPVGTAVYSRTVLLNHSCSGNTARYRTSLPSLPDDCDRD